MNDMKIYIGPMSLNIVDCIINYCNNNNINIVFIPSRRQIEYNTGYVNNWNTQQFVEYVKNKTTKCLIERDHSGPGQNTTDYIKSLKYDCLYMDIIHIDPWKQYPEYIDGLHQTIELISYCYSQNPNIYYEIATEEAIRKFTVDELEKLILDLKYYLNDNIFKQIKYLVIQSGTSLEGIINTGNFDINRLESMVKLANKYNLLSKEHNGDFLTYGEIKIRFDRGLNGLNIAPEFGQIETKVILNEIKNNNELFEKLYKICYDSNKWKKWVKKIPSKEELIIISGHYLFTNEEFINIKYTIPDIDNKIKLAINSRLDELNDIINK